MSLLGRIVARFVLGLSLTRLKVMFHLAPPPFFVDYGWVKLPFTNDGDRQELYYHMNCGTYYRHDFPVLAEYLRPGDVVVDVGSNMGFLAAMFASLVGHEGHVFCFEPSKRSFRKLNLLCSLNDLTQVSAYNVGCSSADSESLLHTTSHSSGDNSLVRPAGKGPRRSEAVRLVALDSVIDLHGRDVRLLKIDTEGHEADVLQGASALLGRCRPVVYIELGRDHLESSKRAVKILASHGYRPVGGSDLDLENRDAGTNFVFTNPQGNCHQPAFPV